MTILPGYVATRDVVSQMDLVHVDMLITNLGVICQTVVAALLFVFFRFLGLLIRRRRYVICWMQAWGLLALALGVLLLATGPQARDSWSTAGLFLYLYGKLLFFLLIALGAYAYAQGLPRRRTLYVIHLVTLAYALGAFALSDSIRVMLQAQVPWAVLTAAAGGWSLWRLPEPARSPGSRAAALAVWLFGGVWTVYLWIYQVAPPTFMFSNDLWSQIARYSPFFDAVMELVLAFGMLRLLLEDGKRETDGAYAELELAFQRLLAEAYRDSLTGVLNRRAFEEGVGLEAARRAFGTVAVFDLDNLKYVNDTRGHIVGDALLRYFAVQLQSRLRPLDRLYRWGGDEFLLVLTRATPEDSRERLTELLADIPPMAFEDRPVPIQVSLGCARFEIGALLPEAIRRADREMYAHKQARKTPASTSQPGDVTS